MKLDASVSLLALPKLSSEPTMLREERKPVSAPYNSVSQRHLGWGWGVLKAVCPEVEPILCSMASPVLQG